MVPIIKAAMVVPAVGAKTDLVPEDGAKALLRVKDMVTELLPVSYHDHVYKLFF